MTQINYWIGVASREHVQQGISLGICQFCHGKLSPLKRLRRDDFIIYYSPKHFYNNFEPCQKFTAIGQIIDDDAYQVEINSSFKPFRRNIKYYESDEIDIKPLITHLSFIKNKKAWGVVFRYGFLKIDEDSFKVIAEQMLGTSMSQLIHQKSVR